MNIVINDILRYFGDHLLLYTYPITMVVLNTLTSCLVFCNSLLTDLLTLIMALPRICSPHSTRVTFLKSELYATHFHLKPFNTFSLVLTWHSSPYRIWPPSTSPASPLNSPLTLSTPYWSPLSSPTPQNSFDCRAFTHATSSFWNCLHPAHLSSRLTSASKKHFQIPLNRFLLTGKHLLSHV